MLNIELVLLHNCAYCGLKNEKKWAKKLGKLQKLSIKDPSIYKYIQVNIYVHIYTHAHIYDLG